MADRTVFKRLNFFRGFLTTEEDWNDGERYHLQKRQLHNQVLHAPGIVPQYLDGLRVRQRGRGDLNIEVSAGYAIDGQGRDLYLPEPVIKAINPADSLDQGVWGPGEVVVHDDIGLLEVAALTEFVRGEQDVHPAASMGHLARAPWLRHG